MVSGLIQSLSLINTAMLTDPSMEYAGGIRGVQTNPPLLVSSAFPSWFVHYGISPAHYFTQCNNYNIMYIIITEM